MDSFIIVYLLEPKAIGADFTEWPLHVTIMPWFEAPSAETVLEPLRALVKNIKPISILVQGEAHFGARGRRVALIKPDPKLQELHEQILDLLSQNKFPVPGRFIGAHYQPHVTEHPFKSVQDGTELTVDRITLAQSLPMNKRRLVDHLYFGANHETAA